jgi:hypothetical protein
MSYKVEVIADNSGKWVPNSMRFATAEEAGLYAANLFSRWMAVKDTRVMPSEDPVNYRWVDGRSEPVEGGK